MGKKYCKENYLLNSGLLLATVITGVKLEVRNDHTIIMSMSISGNTRVTGGK